MKTPNRITWTIWGSPEQVAAHPDITNGQGNDDARLMMIVHDDGALRITATSGPQKILKEAQRKATVAGVRITEVLVSEPAQFIRRLHDRLLRHFRAENRRFMGGAVFVDMTPDDALAVLREWLPKMEEPQRPESLSREAGRPQTEIPSFLRKEENPMNQAATVSSAQPEAGQGLIPVFAGEIGGVACNVCDGRALHTFLEVGKHFGSWIHDRIEKYGLVENQDFISFSQNREKPQGGRPNLEYHLTLDTAKELSMVENNEQGRAARRYFIECERRVLENQPQIGSPIPEVVEEACEGRSWRLAEELRAKIVMLMGSSLRPEDDELAWAIASRVKDRIKQQLLKTAKDHLAKKLRPNDVANWIMNWEPSGFRRGW